MSIFPITRLSVDGEAPAHSWWLYLLLGIVLLVTGFFVLGNVVLASAVSAIFIGWAIVIAGILEIVHAFSAREWKGFLLDLFLGILYIAGGWLLVSNPLAATVSLTLAIGVIWIVSGISRIVLAGALWREGGWGILFSGLLAVLAGALILAQWPASGLWVLGFLLGIDLIVHGIAWIGYAFSVRSGSAEDPTPLRGQSVR
jgi:uncharacterized membrane protein HdeD (DUF308 family)